MNGRLLDLHVCVQGRPLPEYHHDSATWVEGRSGSEYVLRLRNRTGKRVEVVLTVDGINVVNAEEGSASGIGYVLNPWQTADIKGFLRDAVHAATFTFGAGGDAYRTRLGRDGAHLGVIGAAVFEEKEPPFNYYTASSELLRGTNHTPPPRGGALMGQAPLDVCMSSCQVTPGSETSAVSVQSLGTSYGREVDFVTSRTTFERATEYPVDTLTIRYDDADALRRHGVPVGAIKPTPVTPSAFPADQITGCPPPKGWMP